jgi:hypothetical protein
MNGCELPCGNVLSVQPATNHATSSNYGPAASVTMNPCGPSSPPPTNNGTVATPTKEETAPAVKEEEDLDDFFASLE